MSEKDLSAALLRGEHPIDVTELTRRVLRRDRRRMWILGMLCVIAWMLVVMLPWATILPMLAKVGQYLARANHFPNATGDYVATTQPELESIELARIVKEGTVATFLGSIASMFMAAVSTVSLIIASRRATLRQVNARLAEISDQLKVLAAKP